MLTQNGIDKSIPLELDLVRNITWGNSEIAYGGGVVFRANNGINLIQIHFKNIINSIFF